MFHESLTPTMPPSFRIVVEHTVEHIVIRITVKTLCEKTKLRVERLLSVNRFAHEPAAFA